MPVTHRRRSSQRRLVIATGLAVVAAVAWIIWGLISSQRPSNEQPVLSRSAPQSGTSVTAAASQGTLPSVSSAHAASSIGSGARTLAQLSAAIQTRDVPGTIARLVASDDPTDRRIALVLNYWCAQTALMRAGVADPAFEHIEKSPQFVGFAAKRVKEQLEVTRARLDDVLARCGRASEGIFSGFPPGYDLRNAPKATWNQAFSLGGIDGRFANMSENELRDALIALGENDPLVALSLTSLSTLSLFATPIMGPLVNERSDRRTPLTGLAVAAVAGCDLVPELCAPGTISHAYLCAQSAYVLCMTDRPDETARLLFRNEREQLEATARAVVEAIRRGDHRAFIRPPKTTPAK